MPIGRRSCFTVRRCRDVRIVDAHGNLDRADATPLDTALERAAWVAPHVVLLTLGGVSRMGIGGLGRLLTCCIQAHRCRVRFVVVCPARCRVELLLVARLAVCLEIFETEAAACAALSGRGARLPEPPLRRAA